MKSRNQREGRYNAERYDSCSNRYVFFRRERKRGRKARITAHKFFNNFGRYEMQNSAKNFTKVHDLMVEGMTSDMMRELGHDVRMSQ